MKLYGMCCQKPVKDNIVENYDTGEYKIETVDSRELYEKYVNKYTSVLLYQTGILITSYGMRNLFELGKCAGTWLYSDTDSCYGQDWDMQKVEVYNNKCKQKLNANGYGAVIRDNKEYWLGVAEFDGFYPEMIYVGSKRYACRKENGDIKITVAGVPKIGAKCLNNDLNNFKEGFIFSGDITNKKTYTHIIVDKIYIDEG